MIANNSTPRIITPHTAKISLVENGSHSIKINTTNKYYIFFNEILLLVSKYYLNEKFLKIYENFKPYLKFFFKCLKELDTKQKLNRILIVDDNKLILKALKNVTNAAIKELKLTDKVEIIKVYDGVDALALFKIDHYTNQSLELIISDHNMSMMEGRDFLNMVNKYKLEREIKLVISSTDNEILKTLNVKEIDFLNKPAKKTDIIPLINKHLD